MSYACLQIPLKVVYNMVVTALHINVKIGKVSPKFVHRERAIFLDYGMSKDKSIKWFHTFC